MNGEASERTVEQLAQSTLYRDYERAFGDATGMPLNLVSAGSWHLALHGQRHENAFCALLAKRNKTCAACLRAQGELMGGGAPGPRTTECFAGLCESSVPIRTGDTILGYLRTGEVATRKPTPAQFSAVLRQLRVWGITTAAAELRRAYFSTRVVPKAQYRSMLDLLTIFASHLSMVAGQIVCRSEHAESPVMTRARQFIADRKGEHLRLKQVSDFSHMSSFYFCKKFKQTTGFTFTEYVARVRVEAAKTLLLNPQARISEVAFEVGFQSITHFNRVFKGLVGHCPTDYRSALPQAA